MNPGCDLDALVAEKVMGLTLRPLGVAPCPYCEEEMRPGIERSWCSQCQEWRYGPAKEYSTNIAAAWEVVEKMRADGWTFHVDDVGFNDATEGEWRVMFTEATTGNEHVFADGQTAPHAICLAALKVVEVSI